MSPAPDLHEIRALTERVGAMTTELAKQSVILEQTLARQDEINAALTAQAERHARWIYGHDDVPGAKVALDRLQQADGRRTAISLAALTGMIGLVLEKLLGWLVGPH